MTADQNIYRRQVDPEGRDSLAAIVRQIRPGSRVLELGVATGYLSRHLTETLGCRVDGVEIDPGMAREAAAWCHRLVVMDLGREPLRQHFPLAFYDYVIAADVLEHLIDPAAVVRQIPALLAAHGRLILSLPNSAYAGLVLELLSGEWRYRPEGLLDQTHLRFFTEASARRLLSDQGFQLERVEPVYLPFDRSEFHALFQSLAPELVARVVAARTDPDAREDAYQYVMTALPALETRSSEPLVDLVVPVFRGPAETRRCLESVLRFPQATPFELIVIDDASPDPELRAYLDQLAARGSISLIRNAHNQGFTSCANRGLMAHPWRDLLLLNSDTEVHGDWLDRLYRVARASHDVGTVTPLTNCGTIAAYPRFCEDNPLPDGAALAALDNLTALVNPGQTVEIPTAVGFCMYITRRCADAVGLFDQEHFPRGYGEENDFCMRASQAGFRHLLCAEVYVAHQGSVSFGEEKQGLYQRGAARLAALHPDYFRRVATHTGADPARLPRRRLDLARLAASPLPRLLLVSHCLGGGTERHVRELAQVLEPVAEVLILRTRRDPYLELEWARRGEELRLYFPVAEALEELLGLCRELGVARVHIHHLLGYPPAFWDLGRRLGLPYDFSLHDYYAICPQYNLTRIDGRYCGEPDAAGCNVCLQERPAPSGLDIETWRQTFGDLLRGAERVLVPSRDVLERLRRYLPDAPYHVLPHPEIPVRRVLVLGTLSLNKGAKALEEAARDARTRDLPLYFRVLGRSAVPVMDGEDPDFLAPGQGLPLSYGGEYLEQSLPELIRREQADVIYFPAQWPETYSYTLSAALDAGLPILAPDCGAFVERLADHPRARLLPWNSPPARVNDALLTLAGPKTSVAGLSVEAYRERYLANIQWRMQDRPVPPERIRLLPQRCYRDPPDFAQTPLTSLQIAERVTRHLGQVPGTPLARPLLERLLADAAALPRVSAESAAVAQAKEQQVRLLEEQLAAREAELTQALHHREAELAFIRASRPYRLYRAARRPWRVARHSWPYVQRVLRDPARGVALLKLIGRLWRQGGMGALREAMVAGVLRRAQGPAPEPPPSPAPGDYAAWLAAHEDASPGTWRRLADQARALAQPPRISLILPTFNTPEDLLREAIESVLGQAYPHWELCIADDASTAPGPRPLLEAYVAREPRIRLLFRPRNGHISAASNNALALASGDFVAFLDHDDRLAPLALTWVAKAILAHPDCQILYSDEDKLDAQGNRRDPYFKPDWNPDLFRSQNLIGHLGVFRRSLVEALGGFREGFDGAQDYDLALRAVERVEPHQILHIPRVLYHWRALPGSTASAPEAKPYAQTAALRALQEHLDRLGEAGKALPSQEAPGLYRIRYALPADPPQVTLIILTRNQGDLLRRCVESLLGETDYPAFDILILDNGSDDPTTLAYLGDLARAGRVSLLRDPAPFNFSVLNNRAVRQARGSFVCLLNNDTEVINGSWLKEMMSHALRPGVGAVGARLWYPDNRLQHGGVILGVGGVAGHAHKGLPKGHAGYFGRAVLTQNLSALTGACLLLRKELYEAVGGLDAERLPVAFNDIDLCLRIRDQGYRLVWTPHAQLYHHESISRGYEDTPEKQARFQSEVEEMQRRWGERLLEDPAYNPNLTLAAEDFSLAWPPRIGGDASF